MSEETLDATNAGAPARPVFITVLVILTWVGSAWGIIGTLMNMSPIIPMWYNIAIILCNVLTGYGAFQMWKLSKQGLMIYTIGEVVAMILPFILVDGIFGGVGMVAQAMASLLLIMTIFPIAFIVMYWLNAKHLK